MEYSFAETDVVNLSRALSRLEHKILSSSADPRLKKSSYERTKTSAVSLLLTHCNGSTMPANNILFRILNTPATSYSALSIPRPT